MAVKESWRDVRELSLVRSERQSFVQNEKKTMPKPVMCYYIVITLPKQITLAKKAIAYF